VLRLLAACVSVAAFAALGAEPAGPASLGHTRQLKIGLVAPAPTAYDPWQRQAVAGLQHARHELGVKIKVLTVTPREGSTAPLTAFARAGYDLVIGNPGKLPAFDQVARAFPGIRFAGLDFPREWFEQPAPRNVTGIVFRAQEAGYLAGYLAGLVEKRRPGRDVVSAVGGFSFPGVDRWIAGYRAGARRADPGIEVLIDYAQSFTARQLCAAAAASQIAKGSGVVFAVAGACGLGALGEAKERGVWGVGVDTDQSSLGRHILTSAVTKPAVAVYRTIRALRRHRYRIGADMPFGLRDGGVGLKTISRRVPRSLRAAVQRIKRKIASGQIAVPATLG
jgi:basic membrane protein A and related proteins